MQYRSANLRTGGSEFASKTFGDRSDRVLSGRVEVRALVLGYEVAG